MFVCYKMLNQCTKLGINTCNNEKSSSGFILDYTKNEQK